MKINRRSVLGAIGLVGVGTGAAFGSGAFSSTTAERAVEVNVFGAGVSDPGTDGVVSGLSEEEEDDLADDIAGNFVDVLVDASSPTVDIYNAAGNTSVSTDGTDVFPEKSGTYTNISTDYVSLVANDVTIVFGDEDGLPPNSNVNYTDFFAFVGNASNDFNVTFGDTNGGSILNKVDGKTVSSGATKTVTSGTTGNFVGANVKTGTADNSREQLDIRIEQSDSN
ncbi:hypothetical protein [Halorubrum sp. PV6]|uniref:hypothetical protein n=1 Tax=Halorubrum sp. PV6 TaxID=634157 RepID=UPI00119848A5|nr:hypothetical protein [Halorubrum sp. PV6]AZQ16086.1 hypothetical protein DOS48_14575 [Halorubrum sp. PV6]